MKKTSIIVVLYLTFGFLLFAGEMTTTQQRIYNSQALSVQQRVETSGTSSASAFSTNRYSAFAFGSSESTSTVEWDAYQGASKISKAEFFRIAGYPDYEKICLDWATKYEKEKSTGIALTAVGLTGSVVGLVLEYVGCFVTEDRTQVFIGAGVGLGFLITATIGWVMLLNADAEPDISTSFAIGVADIYNQELQASIMLNY